MSSQATDVPGIRSPEGPRAKRGLRKDFETPTLEQIERRRFELLGITFFLLIAVSVGVALVSFTDFQPEFLRFFGGTATVIRVSLVALALGFTVYVMDKERVLRRMSKALVNERVLGAAFSNRLKEISLVTEAGKAVISALELEEVLGVILGAAFELLEADEGSILLVEGEDLVVSAVAGDSGPDLNARYPVSEYPVREPRLSGPADAASVPAHTNVGSAMTVPLSAEDELLGMLTVNVVVGARRYDEYDLRALGLFAEHAAMAIRNARALRREQELRQHIAELDRVRAELVASMAHDLKTPLTTILGAARLVATRNDKLTPEKRAQLLSAVESQARRLLALIERLLDAARSQARHLPLALTLLDLEKTAVVTAEAYASAHGRRIRVHTEDGLQPVIADAEAVDQILSNLLENAVKYTPADGTIHLELRGGTGEIAVTVRDEGPGIPSDDAEHLFMPFRRGRSGGSGVGLGLFIVSNLVRAMGGRIWVDSPPGEGAAFTFTLPVEPVGAR